MRSSSLYCEEMSNFNLCVYAWNYWRCCCFFSTGQGLLTPAFPAAPPRWGLFWDFSQAPTHMWEAPPSLSHFPAPSLTHWFPLSVLLIAAGTERSLAAVFVAGESRIKSGGAGDSSEDKSAHKAMQTRNAAAWHQLQETARPAAPPAQLIPRSSC